MALSCSSSRWLRFAAIQSQLPWWRGVTTFSVPRDEDAAEERERLARERTFKPRLPKDLPPPDPADLQIRKVELVSKSASLHRCPFPKHAEFAFVGHSNVGKSSLINMLTGGEVSKASSQPGARNHRRRLPGACLPRPDSRQEHGGGKQQAAKAAKRRQPRSDRWLQP